MQQQLLRQRGHKDDPLYRIRRPLRHGVAQLTAGQIARPDARLVAGDPAWEVPVSWLAVASRQLPGVTTPRAPGEGRRRAERVIEALQTCPIPEVSRLGRTLWAWRTHPGRRRAAFPVCWPVARRSCVPRVEGPGGAA